MAEWMNVESLRDQLRTSSWTEKPFWIFRSLGALCGQDEHAARELTIRALENRAKLKDDDRRFLDALVGRLGLFPYLDELDDLDSSDLLAYELHRPFDMDEEDIVFHAAQARAYRALLDGQNLILSAPTSFGKSLLIDAILALRKFSNIVVIVPTIALIDETRRRLTRFQTTYKLITHGTQAPAERNVFVMTQERFLALEEMPAVDFFVIDEFYKLDPEAESGASGRAYLLNETFYRLYKTGAQFYLLGPNIQRVAETVEGEISYHFLRLDFETVVTEVKRIEPTPDVESATTELLTSLPDPTLVYCKSPKSARALAQHLLDSGLQPKAGVRALAAADWVAEQYHPEWGFVQALRRGIGVHHGKLPRAIGQFIIRAFEQGDISLLLCTSTLIEGVNTAAKNVVVYDNKIAMSKLDFFTFSNIRGRSGRMFRHFVGHVYVLEAPPDPTAQSVDFPFVSQGEDVPTELLVQIDEEDLEESSKERLRFIGEQSDLSIEVVRQAHGVQPEKLIGLARRLKELISNGDYSFIWSGLPRYNELLIVAELIWTELLDVNFHQGVSSPKQLTFFLNKLRQGGVTELIEMELGNGAEASEAVEKSIDFVRAWAQFLFPKMLRAFHLVQEEVLTSMNVRSGSYIHYADQLESIFTHPSLMALEEFGLPVEIGLKLQPFLRNLDDLDAVLDEVRSNLFQAVPLSAFERSLLEDLRDAL